MRSVHPGEVLREVCVPSVRASKTQIAAALGLSRQSFYDLLNCKVPISPVTALRIERLFGGSAEMWLKLQDNYDLAILRRDKAAELDGIKALEAA